MDAITLVDTRFVAKPRLPARSRTFPACLILMTLPASLAVPARSEASDDQPVSCIAPLATDPAARPEDNLGAVHEFPNHGVLIGTMNSLLIATARNGRVQLTKSVTYTPELPISMANVPGAGVLISTGNTVYLARNVAGTPTVTPIPAPLETRFSGEITTLGALASTAEGWRLVRAVGGNVRFEAAKIPWIPGNIDPRHDPHDIGRTYPLPGVGMLAVGTMDVFTARTAHGEATFELVAQGNVNQNLRPYAVAQFPGSGVLIGTRTGLMQLDIVGATVTPHTIGFDLGDIHSLGILPGIGVLIHAEHGFFVSRVEHGNYAPPEQPFATPGNDVNTQMVDLPGIGILLANRDGWFLPRYVDNTILTRHVPGPSYSGIIDTAIDLPGAGVVVGAGPSSMGNVFLASTIPLASAHVSLLNVKSLEHAAPDPANPKNFIFSIDHACVAALSFLDVRAEFTPPNQGNEPSPPQQPVGIRLHAADAEVIIPYTIYGGGLWKVQLVSVQGDHTVPVGPEFSIKFPPATDARKWLDDWGWWVGKAIAFLLGALNLALFVAARWSPRAWRIATDDGLKLSAVLRIATFVLGYWQRAQIWVLDSYFRRRKPKPVRAPSAAPSPSASPAAKYLSIALTGADSSLQPSDQVTAPPWNGRRLWIQGSSGMGKTALIQWLVNEHFSASATAFDAWARWGCIMVDFRARDFADGAAGEANSAWVFKAVKSTLSAQGLPFESDSLLRKFLASGTLLVVIDGIHEVGGAPSVEAFARDFDAAPMLVSSQDVGDPMFAHWRLPLDMSQYKDDLLRLSLGTPAAETVIARIKQSGLDAQIKSGYDVRLIADLARVDPAHGALPSNRIGLYAAVIAAGWPDGTPERIQEQQDQTAAAAWRMVSQRKPFEDSRRLTRGDLSIDLLKRLADAPKNEGKSVRLLQALDGGKFEFVHDQMHAYLAARWFAQQGFSVRELEKMISESAIWSQSIQSRQTLWAFIAALLDDERLLALLTYVEDVAEWDVLRRQLKAEAQRRRIDGVASSHRPPGHREK
jgi:hypothetical protein